MAMAVLLGRGTAGKFLRHDDFVQGGRATREGTDAVEIDPTDGDAQAILVLDAFQ